MSQIQALVRRNGAVSFAGAAADHINVFPGGPWSDDGTRANTHCSSDPI